MTINLNKINENDLANLSPTDALKLVKEISLLNEELTRMSQSIENYETIWATSQKVITSLNEDLEKEKKQSEFWKQEFADASKQSLDTLDMMQNTKVSLETVMHQFFKYENK